MRTITNYKLQTTNFIKHPLFAGSFWMIFGNNFANFLAYIYHLIVGRMLGPTLYGELAVIISISAFFSISFIFLGLSIVKFISSADTFEIQSIISWFFKKSLIFGIILALVIFALTPFLSNFLHIDGKNLIFLAPIFLFMLLGYVMISFLQGLLRFKEMAVSNSLFMLGRILFAISLIILGFKVLGAVIGLLLASILGFLVSRYFVRDFKILDGKNIFKDRNKVLKYTLPVFVNSLATNLMLTTDIILVKHFFDSYTSGIYASTATLGKVIFWAGAPIAGVMFPIISKKHAKGESYQRVFAISLLMTLGISVCVLLVYLFLPKLSIEILYGSEFLEASKYLFTFGIYMTIFTLSSFFINFYLSRDRVKVTFLALLASIIQAVGIWFFHDSLITVIKISTVSVSFLLLGLIIYFRHDSKS